MRSSVYSGDIGCKCLKRGLMRMSWQNLGVIHPMRMFFKRQLGIWLKLSFINYAEVGSSSQYTAKLLVGSFCARYLNLTWFKSIINPGHLSRANSPPHYSWTNAWRPDWLQRNLTKKKTHLLLHAKPTKNISKAPVRTKGGLIFTQLATSLFYTLQALPLNRQCPNAQTQRLADTTCWVSFSQV